MINILEFLSKKQVYGTLIILASTYFVYKIIIATLDKIQIKGKDELEKKRKGTWAETTKYIARPEKNTKNLHLMCAHYSFLYSSTT